MLGVWSTPSRDDNRHLEECIAGKTRTWVRGIKSSSLTMHLTWCAYRYQLLPALWYGLGTLATKNSKTKMLLDHLEFDMLSHMGVNKHIKKD
jgi:hypothetical protein